MTAERLQCIVTVGYPEVVSKAPQSNDAAAEDGAVLALLCYNSTITVSPDGRTLAHYRKTHLYYTDETWAHESDTKWLTTGLPLKPLPMSDTSSLQMSEISSVVTTFGSQWSSVSYFALRARVISCESCVTSQSSLTID